MPILQGLDILVSIYRREQQADDEVGGSVIDRKLIYSHIQAKITSMRTPMFLRAQGIETTNNFDCVVQPSNYIPLTKIEIDDILVPETGMYAGLDFVITNAQDNPVANSPVDYRFIHRNLSLRRTEVARKVQ